NAHAFAGYLMDSGVRLISNGTDNHMMLADLTGLNITGKGAEDVLGRSGMTVNKNAIPFETRSPQVTSGIRIGTPAVTSRGMKEPEMATIAQMMVSVLKNPTDETLIAKTRKQIRDLCDAFPICR
ncbi:MAG: serine hydroxymethyltransferase, partial [Desulfatirhabdiaceae bacterium]